MSINLSEVILTVVNFIVLMLLLNRFLYQPVLRFMDARRDRIQAGLDAQTQAEQALADCQTALQEELAAEHQQTKQVVAAAKRQAHDQCDVMAQEAVQQAQARKQAAAAKVQQEEQAHYTTVHAQMPRLVQELTARLLQDEAAAQKHAAQIAACVETAGQAV